MSQLNLELYSQVQALRRQDMRRDAQQWRLARWAGSRPVWLSQRGCWVLCQIGRWLVRVGEQLQSYGRYGHDWLRP